MYHAHHNSAAQVGKGLLGAFIVAPRNAAQEPRVALDYVMILNDGVHGYTLNGKDFPATEPLVCRRGDLVRIRYMNEGMMIHPMHLHGMHMTVIAKDGWPLPMPFRCDTLNIAPGERWDVLVKATNPGTWAFHCHILTHAEAADGMFGMVTALIVT
jgi:FtsP/CotA-like multicopper oxidase with cupredoxin domain